MPGESQDQIRNLCGSDHLGGHCTLDRGQRLFGAGSLGTARLSHVRAAAAALASQSFGTTPDQLDRIPAELLGVLRWTGYMDILPQTTVWFQGVRSEGGTSIG